MYAIHKLARYFEFLFMVLASIPLASCVSSPLPLPLPPPPPYENYPGEAAKVKNVLNDIEKNQHMDAPRPVLVRILPFEYSASYPRQEYPAQITLSNETGCNLGFYLGGPIFREFGLETGKSVSLYVKPGKYLYGVDTRHCSNIPRLLGNHVFEAGKSYSWKMSKPKTGTYVIKNHTSKLLTFTVGGKPYEIQSGSSYSIELTTGSHTATIFSECGRKDVKLEIVEGMRHEGVSSCVTIQQPIQKY